MLSRNMTIASAIIGAAALLATPAFAAKAKKKAAAPKAHVSQTQRSPDGIYSWDGRYLGNDPDPNIRFQLHAGPEPAARLKWSPRYAAATFGVGSASAWHAGKM